MEDIKELERDGLCIDTDVLQDTVQISIAQVSGDNLGLNGIFGLVESFVSHHFCRNCKMHIEEMRRALAAN